MIKKKWQMSIFITFFIFALLVTIQYRAETAFPGSLSNQKPEDLVAIVKKLNEKRTNLEMQATELMKTKQSLDEQTAAGARMTESLKKELSQLEVINGTVPVEGPGVIINITGDSYLDYHDIIDLVNELWVSGAEVVSINNIRYSDHTVISLAEDDKHRLMITVDDEPLLMPVVIKAIGNPDTLEEGLTFPGGIIDYLSLYQVYPKIKKEDNILIPKVQLN